MASSHAFTTLELLRENKNKFDLVISDVQMPDMDGFKLLELVGLEKDLLVIMLSSNGDNELVMKGVTHGACDYLVALKTLIVIHRTLREGDLKTCPGAGEDDQLQILPFGVNTSTVAGSSAAVERGLVL